MRTNILSFLNSDIAEKFEANFRAQRPTDGFSSYAVRHGSSEKIVRQAFVWSETPEGSEFWKIISDLWLKFLKEGGEPMPENLTVDMLLLEHRFNKRLEEVKLSAESVLNEFKSLFGEKVFKSFDTNVGFFGNYKNIEDIIKSKLISMLVDLSFAWSRTPEGEEYWGKISGMWKVYWETKTGMRNVK